MRMRAIKINKLSYRDLQLQTVFIENASLLLLLSLLSYTITDNRAAFSNMLHSLKLFTAAIAEDINNFM